MKTTEATEVGDVDQAGRASAPTAPILPISPAAPLTLDEVRARVRVGSKVLWLYRNDVEEGEVVLKLGETLSLCWLEGYKSRNDDIDMSEVLAIWDPSGPLIEGFGWSGKGFVTEAGSRRLVLRPKQTPSKKNV